MKKRICFLLLFLGFTSLVYSRESTLCGDVNGDDKITIIDALLVAHYSVGYEDIIHTEFADVDCNGEIEIIDALLIAKKKVGLISIDCECTGRPCRGIPLNQELSEDQAYSFYLKTEEEFDLFSHDLSSQTMDNMREVKFLILDIRNNPTLYFLNTKRHLYHYYFAVDVLGYNRTLEEFNSITYFNSTRENIAGSLLFYEDHEVEGGKKGIYSLEFCPTFLVRFQDVELVYQMISCQASILNRENLYYQPIGPVQEHGYQEELDAYTASGINILKTEDLYKDVTFNTLNEGEGIGLLRIYGEDPGPLTVRDIVILETLPNDMNHVGGIITTLPQTPLSHINLKAKQNDTPNIYIKGAMDNSEIIRYLDSYVYFKVDKKGFELREASREEYLEHLANIRPVHTQYPQRDLSVTEIKSLSEIGFSDSTAFGAKASNVAELLKILPDGMVPGGFAVPFYFYDRFMRENRFYENAREMMEDIRFQNDPEYRVEALKLFRKKIKNAAVSPQMADIFGEIQESYLEGTSLRCRSSTNNEDLEGFNGAGLYDSKTHHPDEGHISKTIKQVWAGLWTFRAFEEREFYRIDHLSAAMGVLVHPNFKEEQVNGVSVTKNIYDTNAPGYYINAQLGEDLVTNPDERSTPEEFIILRLDIFHTYEVLYLRRSNKIAEDQYLMDGSYIDQLTDAMKTIHRHFAGLYSTHGYLIWNFAMDLEFKITKEGDLVIKQARPWVD